MGNNISNVLRFGQHPEASSLVVLQFLCFGRWFDIDGTTCHSTDDARKAVVFESYAKMLGLV